MRGVFVMTTKYVIYKRLSKEDKSRTQYGFESQRMDIDLFLESQRDYEIIGEYQEFISGAADSKPNLELAMQQCREEGAVLLISKVDRLSRRASQVTAYLEGDVKFTVASLGVDADNFMIGLFALLAEKERDFIRKRIQRGLQVVKRDAPEKLKKSEGTAWHKTFSKNKELGLHKPSRTKYTKSPKTESIISEITKVVKLTGISTYKELTEKVKAINITTSRGSEFTEQNLRNFCVRNNIQLGGQL